MGLVLRLEENKVGRDFAVGDIHGCFPYLEQAMEAAEFDTAKDRIIGVGDLIDKGPQSERALEFLEQEWFFTPRGDHEHVIHEDITRMQSEGREAVVDEYQAMGLGWLIERTDEELQDFVTTFSDLPYVIEVPLKDGSLAAFMHGEVPAGMGWCDFTSKLEAGDEAVIQTALRGRERIISAYEKGFETDEGVLGIGKVFTGHSLSPVRGASRMGNWFCIDTGAVSRFKGADKKFPDLDPDNLHLSLLDINLGLERLSEKRPAVDSAPFFVVK